MAQAFLEHNNPPNATIIVIKGADTLKADVELQYLIQGDNSQLVIFQKFIQVLMDFCRSDAEFVRLLAVLAGRYAASMVRGRAVGQ